MVPHLTSSSSPRSLVQLAVAAMLVGVLAGESPARGACPVTSVVIPGGGAGDQSAESPDVKSPGRLGEDLVGSDKGGEQVDRS